MVKSICIGLFLLIPPWVCGQGNYAPQAGEPGSTAIPKDSSCFRGWAISCDVTRGLRQINVPDSGEATSGAPVYAVGAPDAPLTVSLGDGGEATLQFSGGIYDGPGPDFAVFENGFGTGTDAFLELAFVEVSSDGVHFFRFPSISEVQTDTQTASFEHTDASELHNLAGKYTAHYGTPFDLAGIPDTHLLDKDNVRYVRVIDVVGSVDSLFARYDSEGHAINDPWPTNFPSSGFDLDAVGVIHSTIPLGRKAIHPVVHQGMEVDLLGRTVGNQRGDGLMVYPDGRKEWRQSDVR